MDADGDIPAKRLLVGVTVGDAGADADADFVLDVDGEIAARRLFVGVSVFVGNALGDTLAVGVPDAEAPRVRLPVGESDLLGVALADALTVAVPDVETARPLAEPLEDALAPGDSVDVVEALAPGCRERVGEVVIAGPLAEPLADALAPGDSVDVVEELAPGGSERVGDVEAVLPELMPGLAEDEAVSEKEGGSPIVCDSVTVGVDDAPRDRDAATVGDDEEDTAAPVGDALDDGGAPTVSDAVAVPLAVVVLAAVTEADAPRDRDAEAVGVDDAATAGDDEEDTAAPVGDALDDGGAPTVSDAVAVELGSGVALPVPDTVAAAVFDADAASDRLLVGVAESVAVFVAVAFCDHAGATAAAQRSARKLPRMTRTEVSLLHGNGKTMQENR